MIPRITEVERVLWAASSLKTRELPKTVLKGLLLRLYTTTTNGAGPSATFEQLCSIISRLNIVINGQDQIITIPFFNLSMMNWYDFSVQPQYAISTTASTTVYDEVTIYLPFALTRAVVPEDTLLDLRNVSTATLEVLWGPAAYGTQKTLTAAELQIHTVEYAGVDRKEPFGRHELTYSQGNLSATGLITHLMEYGGINQYKRLMIFTRNSSAALNNAQITALAVRSRNFYYSSVKSDNLQDMNCLAYTLAPQTGVYMVDFTTDGKMSQRLDARSLSELVLEFTSAVSNGTFDVVKEKAIYG